MIESFITVFHAFNRFLGTSAGELLKNSVELLLLVFVTYMIYSEFQRERTRDLKYLIVGFSALAVSRIISTALLSHIVFAEGGGQLFTNLALVMNGIEIIGLVFVANAFIFELKKQGFFARVRTEIIMLLIAMSFLQYYWYYDLINKLSVIFIFEAIKIAILAYPMYVIFKHRRFTKHNKALIFAFGVYAIAPIVNIANILMYSGMNSKLQILAHPFPLLSVLLFTRIVYLKLVNKAVLKSELKKSRELGKMKDSFVSTVSHELRTPLTSMKLYLSLMLQEKFGKLTKKQKETVNVVSKESDRLMHLINDILDVSKLESKEVHLKKKKCNLQYLVNHNPYKSMIDQKGVIVVNEVPPNMNVNVDEGKFRQVFVNLLSNAIKATPENGIITYGAHSKRKDWTFWIEDTGVGINEEAVSRIFDKFYQADNYMTRKEGGTGLGLPIIKHIVDLHCGDISVESEVNKGTKFTIVIPHN